MDRPILQHLIEASVAANPDAAAIIEATGVVSYGELNRRANRIAWALKEGGLAPQGIVAIALPSSAAYVAAQLGVIKAGGVFMPIPLDLPGSRLAQVFRPNTPAALICAEADAAALLPRLCELPASPPLLLLGTVPDTLLWHQTSPPDTPLPEENPPVTVDAEGAAYVVFTSGSSGEPKIILGSQKGLCHFLAWERQEFGLGATLRTLSLAPPTFDVSLRDLLLPLTCGGAVCIPDAATRSQIPELVRFVRASGVNLIHCVPSLFRELTSHLAEQEPDGFAGVNYLLLAGEPLYGADVLRFRQAVGGATRLVNLYGPSETTLAKFFFRIDDEPLESGQIVPVGRPLPNTAAIILKGERLCKIGETGEIHIKTPFRSKGYLGAPELNARAFIQNPLSATPDILYKTGDLGRYRPDRSVDFVGRVDRQVKLRGHRVELPEVEMAIAAIAGVRQVYVRPNLRDGLVDGLTCYYTVATPVSREEIVAALRQRLPGYMIPAFFLQLEKFPLNLHGKVDANRLPKPEELLCRQEDFVPPRTPRERAVAALFAATVGMERISIDTSLLEAGANSLTLIKLAARLYRELGVQVEVATLFARPTARELAAWLDAAACAGFEPIPRTPAAADYPLSPAQRRLWVLDRLEPGNPAYNIFAVDRIDGPLAPAALQTAFAELVARHEILRTCYRERDGEPRQQVLEAVAFRVPLEDQPDEAAALERCRELALLPFALTDELPLRVRLLRLAPETHLLLFTLHHIAGDGWSLGVLLKEFLLLYRAACAGVPAELPPPALQYRDFAAWQNARLADGTLESARSYWRAQLADPPPALPLATDFPRPLRPDGRGGVIAATFDAALTRRLNDLAVAQGATLFMVLQALLRVLLYRYTMQREQIIGTVSAGRTHPELEEQVGFYVNTLALRETLAPEEDFLTLLQRVKTTTLVAFAHQDYPFDRLVDELRLPRDTARAPLFDVLLVLQNNEAPLFAVDGLRIAPLELPEQTSRFDLSFLFAPQGEELGLQINYASALFEAATVAALAGHLQQLARSLSAAPQEAVGRAQLLCGEERERLLALSRGPCRPLPEGLTVIDLIRDQARRRPQAPALIAGEEGWSYRELDQISDRMAATLVAGHGVTPGSRVALHCSRGPWTVLAALAVLKAAAVYLPIDARYPQERIALLARDAAPVLVIRCAETDAPSWPQSGPSVAARQLAEGDAAPLPRPPRPEEAAYVIYTSGSTGRPKGVVVPHRGILNLARELPVALHFGADDRVLQFASPGFDSFVAEVFPALAQGAAVVCSSEAQIDDPPSLAALLQRQRVTVLIAPPAYLANFEPGDLDGLKTLVSAGERPSPQLVRQFAPRLHYLNGYGPTENTVCATLYPVAATQPIPEPLPIGRPIANVNCYLLDDQGELVPDGVVGELALGGSALADGYLGQAELTARAFAASPALPGERLYRSGDLARRGSDGELRFLGRRDDQVKVRGYRIELEEVRQALAAHPQLRDAAVVPVGEAGIYSSLLAAYVAAEPAPGSAELRAFLAARLPAFMVPEQLLAVAQLPLNRHGKLDGTALLALAQPPAKVTAPPQTPAEKLVAALFADLLQLTSPGRETHFFEAGGQSIRAMQLAARLHRQCGAQVLLREIYAHPTVARLAAFLDRQRQGHFAPIPRRATAADYPLSAAQQRLWAIDQMRADAHTPYTLFGVSRLHGPLDSTALAAAFAAMEVRHESLRTRFVLRDGAVRQVVRPAGAFRIEEVDLRSVSDPQAAAAALARQEGEKPFDLAQGPLWRIKLLHTAQDEAWLLLHLHHIVADGWSMGVLQREVSHSYAALASGGAPALPAGGLHYRDFCAWQAAQVGSAELAASGQWWRQQFAGPIPTLELATDFPRPPVQSFAGETLDFCLPPAQVAAMQQFVDRLQVTLFDLLMALVKTLLYRLSGTTDLIVGAPAAGRRHPDLEGLVGFFVNTLPLRDRLDPQEPFAELVRRVHHTHTAALEHQDYPFDRLVDELGLIRDTSRNPLFDVVLALQNSAAVASDLGPLRLEPLPLRRPVSHFDLTFYFSADASRVEIEYCSDLFRAATVAGWFRCLETLLEAALAAPETAVGDLELLPLATRAALARINATARELPPQSLPELFAEQVARDAEACALVHRSGHYSYRWLDQASDLVAATLQQRHGDLHGRAIALLFERGPAMLATIFGVLKLGAAYVPLEPETPAARLAFLLADCEAVLLVTDQRNETVARQLPTEGPTRATVVAVETLIRNLPEQVPPFPSRARPGDLAYLMYTSGSSGRPKGVAVEHRNVVRLVKQTDYCQGRPGDRFLQLSSYAFDGSTFDIFMSLLNGATLCLPETSVLRSPETLGAYLRQERISKFFLTTALFNQLAETVPEALAGCEQIFFGGQEASLRPVRHALEQLGEGTELVHVYGPTETTTFATFHPLPRRLPALWRLPIGKPIANTTIRVLDAAGRPVPPGALGELFIGGAGVARGYHRQADLTAARFVADPAGSGERLYASGDLVRFEPNFDLEFVGRIDAQIKLRGYRIELQEIQNRLLAMPDLREVYVHPLRDPASGAVETLAAYFTLQPGAPAPDADELRRYLGAWLPGYMIPGFFIPLDALPLNRNGKVESAALPSPRQAELLSTTAPASLPTTDLERELSQLLAQVIGRDGLGVDEDFFAAGGDSIKAIVAVGRLREAGWQLQVLDLFEAPTVRALAGRVQPLQPQAQPQPPRVHGLVPLTPVERWFFATQPAAPGHFNQSVLLAAAASIDPAPLRAALEALVAHHDALRSRYRCCKEGWEKSILPADELDLCICPLPQGAEINNEIERVYRRMDLAAGSLFKAVLFQRPEGDRLFLTCHHLVTDGVSWRLLLADLENAYGAASAGRPIELPAATASPGDWALALDRLAATDSVQAERSYWEAQVQAPVGPAMIDPGRFADKRTHALQFGSDFTAQLTGAANRAYQTRTEELLTAALAKALAVAAGAPRTALTLEGHGREPLVGCDISRTLGWFTTLWPLTLDVAAQDPGRLTVAVKEQLRRVPSRGLGFGLLHPPERWPALLGSERVGFNFLGEFAAAPGSFFTQAPEPTGAEISPAARAWHLLDVAALIADGRLSVQFHYHQEHYPLARVTALAAGFTAWLESLVEHCCARQGSQATPVDFDFSGLSLDQFDGLVEGLAHPRGEGSW
ncbi:surfactin non-ribosomal peptide synthetase SrfAA [Desulfuromonas carbonis]|uniref:non-ribosomal peptide synthetase n=1 Tax=Desulfuromonas sp. DDH964 TaxID=1823759 RepID=UPI00078DB15D|nr:non-ribosomal peptide synthetase [Desulfuromonas sp. DDH964]AMV71115.1 AMP-binding protein [Desulfuromonas sp. DDH964]